MGVRARRDLLLALLPLAVAIVVMLAAFDIIPAGLADLLQRAWPGLFVAGGLALLLRGRIPLASLIAVILTSSLVGGIAFAAYTMRADEPRTDQQITIEQEIDDDITLVVVNVSVLDTDVTIVRGTGDTLEVGGQFVGSTETQINQTSSDAVATTLEFFVEEVPSNQFPLLEAVGRGSLSLELPADIGIAVNLVVNEGEVTLNLSDLQLERLTLQLDRGDALITLPEYQPRSLDPEERPGEIAVDSGDVTIFVPDSVDARVAFDRRGSGIQPERDAAYIQAVDGVDGVLRRDVENADVRVFYNVLVPDGLLRLEVNR